MDIYEEELCNEHDERVAWINDELKIQSKKLHTIIKKSIDKATKY